MKASGNDPDINTSKPNSSSQAQRVRTVQQSNLIKPVTLSFQPADAMLQGRRLQRGQKWSETSVLTGSNGQTIRTSNRSNVTKLQGNILQSQNVIQALKEQKNGVSKNMQQVDHGLGLVSQPARISVPLVHEYVVDDQSRSGSDVDVVLLQSNAVSQMDDTLLNHLSHQTSLEKPAQMTIDQMATAGLLQEQWNGSGNASINVLDQAGVEHLLAPQSRQAPLAFPDTTNVTDQDGENTGGVHGMERRYASRAANSKKKVKQVHIEQYQRTSLPAMGLHKLTVQDAQNGDAKFSHHVLMPLSQRSPFSPSLRQRGQNKPNVKLLSPMSQFNSGAMTDRSATKPGAVASISLASSPNSGVMSGTRLQNRASRRQKLADLLPDCDRLVNLDKVEVKSIVDSIQQPKTSRATRRRSRMPAFGQATMKISLDGSMRNSSQNSIELLKKKMANQRLETEDDASPVFRSILLNGMADSTTSDERNVSQAIKQISAGNSIVTPSGSQMKGDQSNGQHQMFLTTGDAQRESVILSGSNDCSPARYTINDRRAGVSNGRRKPKSRGDLHNDIFLESYQMKKSQKEDEKAKAFLKAQIAQAQERDQKFRRFFSQIGFSSDENCNQFKELVHEIELTSQMYEQACCKGAAIDMLSRLDDMMDPKMQALRTDSKDDGALTSKQAEQRSLVEELHELTKLNRYVINLVNDQDCQTVQFCLATYWKIIIVFLENFLARMDKREKAKWDRLETDKDVKVDELTETYREQIVKLELRCKNQQEQIQKLEETVERKSKEIRSLDNFTREQQEFLKQLQDPGGITELRKVLDNFGSAIGMLDEQKEHQLKVMKKACGVLNHRKLTSTLTKKNSLMSNGTSTQSVYQPSPTLQQSSIEKGSVGSLAPITERHSEVSEAQLESRKSFEREFELAKRRTSFIFYQSVLPFKIDNIPPEQLEKLVAYFQNQILSTIVKRKESKCIQVGLEGSPGKSTKRVLMSPGKQSKHGLNSIAKGFSDNESAEIPFGMNTFMNPTDNSDDVIDEEASSYSFGSNRDGRSGGGLRGDGKRKIRVQPSPQTAVLPVNQQPGLFQKRFTMINTSTKFHQPRDGEIPSPTKLSVFKGHTLRLQNLACASPEPRRISSRQAIKVVHSLLKYEGPDKQMTSPTTSPAAQPDDASQSTKARLVKKPVAPPALNLSTLKESKEMTRVSILEKEMNIKVQQVKAADPRVAKKREKRLKQLMTNPVRKLLKMALRMDSKAAGVDPTAKMTPKEALAFLGIAIEEKVREDAIQFEAIAADASRSAVPFTAYLHDRILREEGCVSKACQKLISLGNHLQDLFVDKEQEHEYGRTLFRLIGIAPPPYRHSEKQLVLQAIEFFKICQGVWVTHLIDKNRKDAIPHEDKLSNMEGGGSCSIFIIIDQLQTALRDDEKLCERVMSNIKPDCLYQGYFKNNPALDEGDSGSPTKKNSDKAAAQDCETTRRNQAQLKYSVLRVAWRMRQQGLTPAQVFQQMNSSNSIGLTADAILDGVKKLLGVYMSFEETTKFTSFLDLDRSGDVSQYEFTSKMEYYVENLEKEALPFQVSLQKFIDKMVQDWGFFRDQQKKDILKLLSENGFCSNCSEHSTDIKKFTKLIKAFEDRYIQLQRKQEISAVAPVINLSAEQMFKLYQRALELEMDDERVDSLSQDNVFQLIIDHKIGGFGKEFFTDYLIEYYMHEAEEQEEHQSAV